MTTYTLLLGNMVPPMPGAAPSSRFYGQGTPPDGGGPLGPEQYWPQPTTVSFDNLLNLFGLGPKASAQCSAAPPAAAQPTTVQPTTSQPATSQPATTQPASAQPASAQPATVQPATVPPGTSVAGQNVPGCGTNRPQSIDDIIPPAVRMAGAVAFAAVGGTPATAFFTIVPAFAVAIASLGPDRSGPPARPGFQVGDNEAGYDPVSPTPGDGSAPSEVMTMADWQAGQYLEKGVV